MDSSRIFVRGLPPVMREEEFKKHFSAPSTITDAKYIPQRRIGYVGYRTHDAAVKAVRYFNKSFIRMSRISVELARPVEELKPVKASPSKLDADVRSEKRKHVAIANEEINPKLEEFLQVMQPPSKTTVWSNEDSLGRRIQDDSSTVAAVETGKNSDDDYEHVPKKRKKVLEMKGSSSDQFHEGAKHVMPEIKQVEEHVPSVVETQPQHTASDGPPDTSAVPASDADWLRSRTSRLLGLLNDDEIDVLIPSEKQPTEVEMGTKAPVGEDAVEISNVSCPSGTDVPARSKEIQALPNELLKEAETADRLFVRNLPYDATEDDLADHFARYGTVTELHISRDPKTNKSKGFGHVQFETSEMAYEAQLALDGKTFQGRLLHILPSAAKREHGIDDHALSKLSVKKQKQIKRKAEASSATFKWNSMYMSTDAVMASIANRLGISKSEVLDPTSSDAAVKQAHAETNIIQETKAYLTSHGVVLDAFKEKGFSDTVILVKNFPYGTGIEEIKQRFEAYGSVIKVLMPPTGTIAIIEMENGSQARTAFGALAYSKFKDSILYLEKAPKGVFDKNHTSIREVLLTKPHASGVKLSTGDLMEQPDLDDPMTSSTLYVRNLNFSTNTAQLREVFKPLDGFLSARVKTKTDSKRPGQVLSMGFGFIEFRSKAQAQAAMIAMNGFKLDGHQLLIKASHRAVDAAEERRQEDHAKKLAGRRTKIIIKNLPFEASKKDVRALFAPYGQLRSVRVPMKFDSSTRGFAFADFITAREAENAMNALKDTHLLGRRLVLDFASADSIDPEEEIEKMQHKVGRQADKVALQKLTGTGRKKFRAYDNNEDDGND